MASTNKPGDVSRPVVPTAEAWSRVSATVKRVEGSSLSRTPRPARGVGAWSSGGWIAKATTTITARSGSSYGTGTVQLQRDTGSALADDTSQPTFTAKNLFNKAITIGSYVGLDWKLGSWWVDIPDDCDHLS